MMLLTVICSLVLGAQRKAEPFQGPDAVDFRTADVVSEGTRVAAEVFSLKEHKDKRLPTILMAHGWGGTAHSLRADAVVFAQAGYLVVTFDYRGWGNSDSRVVLTKPVPPGTKGAFTAEVREVREVVDPVDQTADWLNVLHWVHGEPMCDTKRIGLWGSSYSGGHVIYVAARDPRVRATFSQVPGMDSRFVVANAAETRTTHREATQRARGEIGYPEPSQKLGDVLRGAPIRERMTTFAPIEDVPKLKNCATMFVIAEKEELIDNREHGIKAHERAPGPKKLVTVPGTHFDVYLGQRKRVQQLAVEWFDEHLKK